MKSIFIFAISFFGFSYAHAFTSIQFFFLNQQAIITVYDEDATQLYNLMNVPVDQTAFGEGKGIQTGDAEFNLVCGATNKQCKIILVASPFANISGQKGEVRFHAKGELGKVLVDSFYTDSSAPMRYLSQDEKLKVQVLADDEISLFYTKNP